VRTMLSVLDGSPALMLLNDKGMPRAGLCLLDNGRPDLALADDKGEIIWRAP